MLRVPCCSVDQCNGCVNFVHGISFLFSEKVRNVFGFDVMEMMLTDKGFRDYLCYGTYTLMKI